MRIVIEQGLLLGAGGSRLKPGEQPLQFRGAGGGLLQFAHVAGALHVGQALQGFGDFDLFGKPGVEGIHRQMEFAHGGGAAVGAGEAAFAAELVAVGETLVREGVGELEALDAGLTQGDEFAFCGLAVLRGVAPELEFGKRRVGGIEEAVAVGIQCGQRGKAVGGERAVG